MHVQSDGSQASGNYEQGGAGNGERQRSGDRKRHDPARHERLDPAEGEQSGHGHNSEQPGHSQGRVAPGAVEGEGSEGGEREPAGDGKASSGKGGLGHERRKQEHREQEAQSKPSARPAAAAPAAAVPAGVTQATPVPPPAATTVSQTVAPTVATPATPTPGASSPKVLRGFPQAARHGRLNARVKSKGAVGNGTLVKALSIASASAVLPTSVASAAHSHKPAHRSPAANHPSQVVTTITKIVGVVPTALWALLGALFLLALAMAVRSRLTALRARRLERQRGELLEDVGLLQAALLPVAPAKLGPVGTSAAYRPAEGPGAGGDFYDLFALDDGRLAVIVGDVSGHGRQALPHTALVRFTLRAYLEAGFSPRGAMQMAGAVLERQLGESFATVVAATYDPRDRILVYACAGHPPPIVHGSKPIVPITVCSSPPIAAGLRTGTRQTVVSVPGRSQVCFFTDGLTEARVGEELYGADRLDDALVQLGQGATAEALLARVTEQTSARPDDMAACVLNVEGHSGAPRVLVEELEIDRDELEGGRVERFLLACGVEPRELPELIRSTRAIAGAAGTVMLELRLSDGRPQVALRRDKVALLQKPHEHPQTNMEASG
jgi:Stage II sporulation protein E (SpoIIE)